MCGREGRNERTDMMAQTGTALRICPLCEATCGLTLTIDNGRVTGARGDREDVFSHGFICPKGATSPNWTTIPTGWRAPWSDATAC